MTLSLREPGRIEFAAQKISAPFFALDDFARDAALYGASLLFSLVVAFTSTLALYREWGAMASLTYGTAMVLALCLRSRRSRLALHQLFRLRVGLASLVVMGALLVPLVMEVTWRTTTPNPYLHVQPEVTGIERAGKDVASAKDPYHFVDGKSTRRVEPSGNTFEKFFPYLPLMAVFGYASSTTAPGEVTDARVTFVLVTAVVTAAALGLAQMSRRRKLAIAQFLLVLPMGALPLVTGGDDLPVLALLLLGLVLVQRERDLPAGVVFGLAAALKFTAWPIAVLSVLFIAATRPKKSRLHMGLGFMGVLVPIVVPYAVMNGAAFIQNVVLFPLGLSGVESPAASPLLGHFIVTLLPGFHRAYVVLIALVGIAMFGRSLIKTPPRNGAQVALLAGWCAMFAVVVAPSTRVGYLIYPMNFFLWGACLAASGGKPANSMRFETVGS